MKALLNIISITLTFIRDFVDHNKKNRKIKKDGDVARDIREGNGRDVAEEWKRRKKYK